jgi:hypothetical protein
LCTRSSVQPSGVARFRSRRLYSLSASFTSFAFGLVLGACLICSSLRWGLGNDLLSVTSLTRPESIKVKVTSLTKPESIKVKVTSLTKPESIKVKVTSRINLKV